MPIQVQTPKGVVEFPDGMADADIERVLAEDASTPEPAMVPSHGATEAPGRTWTDTAVDALPAVGGSIGGLVGMVGGPAGAVLGAGIGGAGGEGWRRTIQGIRGRTKPNEDTVAGTIGGIGLEGGKQAAMEYAGGKIGQGIAKAGTRLYRGLLKPSRALQQGFGGGDEVAQSLIDAGATISDKGLDKITGQLGASRGAAMKMVQDAAPTSTFLNPKEVIGEFAPVVDTLRKRVDIGQVSELGKVGDRGRRLMRTLDPVTGRVDAARAQVLKETAQDAASGAYRAMERGGAKQLGAEDLLDEATARGFRKAVETRVPGIAAQNQTTQRLLGGKRALEDAVERGRNNLGVGGARDLIAAGVGGSIAGPAGASMGILTRLLSSPRIGSAAAIGLDRTGKKVPIDDLLRALALGLQEPQ